jgi:hypothetical protein
MRLPIDTFFGLLRAHGANMRAAAVSDPRSFVEAEMERAANG